MQIGLNVKCMQPKMILWMKYMIPEITHKNRLHFGNSDSQVCVLLISMCIFPPKFLFIYLKTILPEKMFTETSLETKVRQFIQID